MPVTIQRRWSRRIPTKRGGRHHDGVDRAGLARSGYRFA
jgi:hypothetical protein